MLARLPLVLMVVLFFFYPSLVRVSWSWFSCYPLDIAGQQPYPEYAVAAAPSGYWVLDMQQPCWSGWHKTWALGLGLPCVALFCIGIPLAIVTILIVHRKERNSPQFLQRVGFLIRIFRQEFYCWEVVIAVQTIALVGVAANGHTIGAFYEMLSFTFILGCSLLLHVLLKPYQSKQLQAMQSVAYICLYLTAFVGLTFFSVLACQ